MVQQQGGGEPEATGQPLQAGAGKETDSCPEPQEGIQPSGTLILAETHFRLLTSRPFQETVLSSASKFVIVSIAIGNPSKCPQGCHHLALEPCCMQIQALTVWEKMSASSPIQWADSCCYLMGCCKDYYP